MTQIVTQVRVESTILILSVLSVKVYISVMTICKKQNMKLCENLNNMMKIPYNYIIKYMKGKPTCILNSREAFATSRFTHSRMCNSSTDTSL